MTVFGVFKLTNYTFLQIDRGTVQGNLIVDEYDAEGVFKFRNQIVTNENAEAKQANATLHIKPDETFLEENSNNLIGHGVRVDGLTYQIISQTGGMNFETGEMEHYTVILQESDFVEPDDAS